MNYIFKTTLIFTSLLIYISCSQKKEENSQEKETLKDSENEWIHLSDGNSFEGWHIFKKEGVNSSWIIEDSALTYVGGEDGNSTGNDLISDKEFSSFILSMDWKISKGGNSGVFYGVSEESDFNQHYFTAPEIKVSDNDK